MFTLIYLSIFSQQVLNGHLPCVKCHVCMSPEHSPMRGFFTPGDASWLQFSNLNGWQWLFPLSLVTASRRNLGDNVKRVPVEQVGICFFQNREQADTLGWILFSHPKWSLLSERGDEDEYSENWPFKPANNLACLRLFLLWSMNLLMFCLESELILLLTIKKGLIPWGPKISRYF